MEWDTNPRYLTFVRIDVGTVMNGIVVWEFGGIRVSTTFFAEK